MEIGHKLKRARAAAGMTQEAAAERIGVSRQTISNWENNRSYPDIVSVLKLSDLYSVSLDELLKEDENVTKREEDNIRFLEKHWDHLYDAAVIMLPLSGLANYFGLPGLALVLQILGLLLFSLPRILFMKLFGGGIKNVALGIAGWCLCMGYFLLQILWDYTGIWAHLLFWIGLVLVVYVRNREFTDDRLRKGRWIVYAVILICALIAGFAGLYFDGYFNQANPFGHIYRVEEILYSTEEETPLVNLDAYNNLYLCTDRENYHYTEIGTFTYVQRAEGDQEESLKGLWQLIPEENGKEFYKLTVEADDSVILSYSVDDVLQWKYKIDRVDTLICQVATSGQQSSVYPDWVFAETFSGDLQILSGGTVIGEGTLVFAVEDENITELKVIEEYHCGKDVESREYILTGEVGFALRVSTRHESGNQYAIYRVPYENGEYVFYVEFS